MPVFECWELLNLMKESKEDLNKGDAYCVCMPCRPEHSEMPINSSQVEIILKLTWKVKGTRITKNSFEKKRRVGELVHMIL